MGLELRVRWHRGAMVVVPTGVADGALVPLAAAALAGAAARSELVVLHLDQLTLVEPSPVRELVGAVLDTRYGTPLRLAARRNSAVALLARWRIHHLVPVHRTVEDAIAVHRLVSRQTG